MNDDGCFTEIEAAFYDADHGSDPEAIEATTAFLAALAGDGPALEREFESARVAREALTATLNAVARPRD
jgi:hypothetical protein